MSAYNVLSTEIERDYSDDWQVTCRVDLERDGISGEIWVVAGVPESLRGTAVAARTTRGLAECWRFGDSPDCWCPPQFRADDYDALLEAATPAALQVWRGYEVEVSGGSL